MSAFHSPNRHTSRQATGNCPTLQYKKARHFWYICANIVKKILTQHRFPLLRDAFNMESKNFTQLKQIFPKKRLHEKLLTADLFEISTRIIVSQYCLV